MELLDELAVKPKVSGARLVTLADSSARQGGTVSLDLGLDCSGAGEARVDGEPVVLDGDHDPATFSFPVAGLDLGTYSVVVDCGGGLSARSQLLIFRQNGAERGGANSVVVVTSVGLGSTVALFGLPALVPPAGTRPRRRRTSR